MAVTKVDAVKYMTEGVVVNSINKSID